MLLHSLPVVITNEGSACMPHPCRHWLPKLVALYLPVSWNAARLPGSERRDTRHEETACLLRKEGDSRTPTQLLEGRGSRQLQAGWSEEMLPKCPESQHIIKHHVFKQLGRQGSLL